MIPLLIQDAIDQNHKNPADTITRRLTVSHEAGHLLSCIALGKEITDYDVNRRPHLATLSGMTSTLSARVKKLLNIEEISANLGFVLYKCTNTIDDLLIISSGPAGTLLL